MMASGSRGEEEEAPDQSESRSCRVSSRVALIETFSSWALLRASARKTDDE